ncbi:MAG: bile acid:sodium symporter family protein, partial [Brachybacterium alimentarium]
LPAAIFSIWHNLSGAMLAMYYRRSADRHQVDRQPADPQQADAA